MPIQEYNNPSSVLGRNFSLEFHQIPVWNFEPQGEIYLFYTDWLIMDSFFTFKPTSNLKPD